MCCGLLAPPVFCPGGGGSLLLIFRTLLHIGGLLVKDFLMFLLGSSGVSVRSSVSETCLKKVPFRCFCFGKGFLSLLVGNLDDPKGFGKVS